jgi:hypothetical protein
VKRKLLLLNIALAGMIVWVGFRFREVRTEMAQREQRVLHQRLVLEKYPPFPSTPPPAPMVAANYIDVAQRMLLAKDRNPTVIIDPEPVTQKPPMPPLPVAHGLMLLGEPGIILSERPGAVQRTYRPGEKVGPFKLVAFDSRKVVLDWNGEKVEKPFEEILEKASAPPADSGSAAGTTQQTPQTPQPVQTQPLGPGIDVGAGVRACQPNDSYPNGAVQGGFRKIEVPTPFGKSCRWEPVK